MIIYNSDLRAFLLQGKDVSYAMYVGEAGFLQHLYFGKKLSQTDLQFLTAYHGNAVCAKTSDFNIDLAHEFAPTECGFYARGDYREPTIVVRRSDGAAMSRLRYVDFDLVDGAPLLEGLPCARSGGQTLTVTLADDFSAVRVKLNYTVWDDSNVIARNTEIVNGEAADVTIERAFGFAIDLPTGDYKTLSLVGRWAQERIPQIEDIGHGTRRFQSMRGISSHEMNPFVGILKPDTTENAGDCYGVQLVYSGSFAITTERFDNKPLRVQGGINDIGFNWKLASGESFVTPQALLCFSSEGIGGMSRSYADFIRDRIVNPRFAYAKRPVVVNNWEATYFDFDTDKLFAIIDKAATLGVDTFVLDDGWFGKRDNDDSGLGDWFVNTKKLRGGLKPVIDRCKQNGLKFGLWFEPEMVSEDSDLYRTHPDWAVGKLGNEPSRSRNQLVLDMTRKEVVDYVFEAVSKVLADNDISYVKWDMNRGVTEAYSMALSADKQGEFYHRYTLGVYDLADRLTKAFPEVFFEGCASGGGRFDAGVLYYFPQIWTSDDTDAYERTKIQWGTATCYPQSAMSCHVSACPNHQTQRITPFNTRGVVASLGPTGYELDPTKLSEQEIAQVKTQIADYEKVADLLLQGDSFRLCNPFSGNYFAQMIVAKDKRAAYLCGVRTHGVPCDYDNFVALTGLSEEFTYRIEELDVTASGTALTTIGVRLPRLPDFGAWTWHIVAVD